MRRRVALAFALALGLASGVALQRVTLAPPAAAHVEVAPAEAVAGSTVTLEFSFHHGLDGAATTALEVFVPVEVRVLATPAVAGWEVELREGEGGAHVVRWSGGRVPDGVEAAFPLEVALPAREGVVRFPAVQTTEAGELAWIADEGGPGEDSNPAPRLQLLPDPAAPADPADPAAPAAPAEQAPAGAGREETAAPALRIPMTALQAEQPDDGGPLGPLLVGGGVAALILVVGGGYLLRRHAS